jgi:hypothetical protein
MGIRKVASRLSVLHSEVFWRKADCLYSPSCREGMFPETLIQPVASLSNRTGAKGRCTP